MAQVLIECDGLSKRFGSLIAVDDVSFRVEAGEVMALLGPNGAGKTTTLRMVASILTPSSGRAAVNGFDTVTQPDQVRRSVGLLTEHHGLYTRMRAEEYLAFFGRAYGLTESEIASRASELLSRLDLEDSRSRRLGEFSKGMRQKLALARALLHDPRVLLLDEPTSAMDPASARLVRDAIRALRGGERAVVVSTHNLAEAEMLADRIAIIRRGQLIEQGTPTDLKERVLGCAVMELRLTQPLDGHARVLPRQVRLLDSGDRWLRYETDDPVRDNPALLRSLAQAGASVLSLGEQPRSLEEVYLKVMGGLPSSESAGE
ncbi:MAG: ABC transporter ATP-binding protein [Anaerolineales bacterium]|nr:ABC transporter ATP-binding protein [Anaerolineales bacterium]